MSWPAPPPFFSQPVSPSVPYDSLTQACRDSWVNWAKANKVGWLDYQTIIRPANDAYVFTWTSEFFALLGAPVSDFPPAPGDPTKAAANFFLSSIAITDTGSIAAAQDFETEQAMILFASAPAATPADVDARANQWFTVFKIPAGTKQNQQLYDLGGNYSAVFGTLGAALGKSILFWVFTIERGQMIYSGSWMALIQSVSAFGVLHYWPCDEFGGPRRSTAVFNDISSNAGQLQTAGPIDFSIGNNGLAASPNFISLIGNGSWVFKGWSFSCWFYPDTTPENVHLFRVMSSTAPGQLLIDIWFDKASMTLNGTFYTSGVYATFPINAGAPFILHSWNFVAITVSVGGNVLNGYLNGALNTFAGGFPIIDVADVSIEVGSMAVKTLVTHRFAAAAIWTRMLSASEITSLWNGGATYPYPFP